MDLRFYIDPTTRLPHIRGHGVREHEVEEVSDTLSGRGQTRTR